VGTAEDIKTQACGFQKVLLLGLVAVDEVIAWADSVVASQEQPHTSIIEVSMAGGRPGWEVADLLDAVPGDGDKAMVQRIVFRKMRDVLKKDPDEIGRLGTIFLSLASEGFTPNEQVQEEFFRMEGEIDGARAGVYGDLKSARKRALDLLNRLCMETLPNQALNPTGLRPAG
jgi:hypothetical protein